ncbi:hypothetical protein [Nocardioides alpinus]|uniref:hypothetical protein n=1 Tax=Nocardioides alpinus TaxID=748909 RepID=UPI00355914E9
MMGPGTKDTWVVPAAHRSAMTRGTHPLVVDGVVAGTWRRAGDVVEVSCSLTGDAARALVVEVERLGELLGSDLALRTP